jgi:membrane protease YdiL (CAAX protease family)
VERGRARGSAPSPPDGAALADRPPAPPARWGALSCAFVTLAGLLAAVLTSLLVSQLVGFDPTREGRRGALALFAVALLGDSALVAAVLLLARRILRGGPPHFGLGARPSAAALRQAVLAVPALWLAAVGLRLLQLALVGGTGEQGLIAALREHEGAPSFVLDVLSSVVIAPFAEELLFRGVLFAGLLQRLPFPYAAGLSAATFGLVHERDVLLPIFGLGFGLAYVYWRTETLWAPIVTHAGLNAIPLLIVYFLPELA